mgnify:CR=1 FL=1
MKKKKQQHVQKTSTKQDEPLTLSNLLNQDIVMQLKNKQKELEKKQQLENEAQERRKREEQKRADKNKSFAELLNEDNKDWRHYK